MGNTESIASACFASENRKKPTELSPEEKLEIIN